VRPARGATCISCALLHIKALDPGGPRFPTRDFLVAVVLLVCVYVSVRVCMRGCLCVRARHRFLCTASTAILVTAVLWVFRHQILEWYRLSLKVEQTYSTLACRCLSVCLRSVRSRVVLAWQEQIRQIRGEPSATLPLSAMPDGRRIEC
jgi:hypothetical protein